MEIDIEPPSLGELKGIRGLELVERNPFPTFRRMSFPLVVPSEIEMERSSLEELDTSQLFGFSVLIWEKGQTRIL